MPGYYRVLGAKSSCPLATMASRVTDEEDAELIVRAVNAHDELVEACRLALIEMDRITGDIGFEPERFRERIAAAYALGAALAKGVG